MVKKIVRMGLPLAVALGLALPFAIAFAQWEPPPDIPKAERKGKKKTEKPKRKGGGEKKKAGEYKGQ